MSEKIASLENGKGVHTTGSKGSPWQWLRKPTYAVWSWRFARFCSRH